MTWRQPRRPGDESTVILTSKARETTGKEARLALPRWPLTNCGAGSAFAGRCVGRLLAQGGKCPHTIITFLPPLYRYVMSYLWSCHIYGHVIRLAIPGLPLHFACQMKREGLGTRPSTLMDPRFTLSMVGQLIWSKTGRTVLIHSFSMLIRSFPRSFASLDSKLYMPTRPRKAATALGR